jgi:NTE family protein
MSERMGLVLSGGGAKGAYQAGVFRALRDLGIDRRISVVAGTSIGALNGALYVQDDLEQAEALWRSIHPAMFTEIGLAKALDEHLRPGVLATARQSLYATCATGFPIRKVTYFCLSGSSPLRARRILEAAAALPVLFSPVEIDGTRYGDGGVGIGRDNVPVFPVYQRGCDTIIVIHLKREDRVDSRLYPGARIIEVRPSEHLGSVWTGNLDYDPRHAVWRMELGYRDAIAQLRDLRRLAAA